MKFTFLGTAAAEGIPAVFCNCPQCLAAWKAGGREIRTRSGAIIDDKLKLDFGPDSYAQMLREGIRYYDVENILITHTHEDHYSYLDIANRRKPYSQLSADAPALTVWGNEEAGRLLVPYIEPGVLEFKRLKPFEPQDVGGYTVTALEAVHKFDEQALFYLIEKDGKSILYAHDTDEFTDADMAFLAGKKINFISMDCTNGVLDLDYIGHMGINDNLRMREKLIANGAADENTVFVCNHFSHNGSPSIEIMQAKAPGFLISYDGMKIEV